MDKYYSSYECRKCKREIILINDDIKSALDEFKYIACPYCACKNIKVLKEEDSLRDVMKARSYKRVRGALRERW
ncbi:MAG: hypothetical protein ACRC41_18070 [Sarcina sp.]